MCVVVGDPTALLPESRGTADGLIIRAYNSLGGAAESAYETHADGPSGRPSVRCGGRFADRPWNTGTVRPHLRFAGARLYRAPDATIGPASRLPNVPVAHPGRPGHPPETLVPPSSYRRCGPTHARGTAAVAVGPAGTLDNLPLDLTLAITRLGHLARRDFTGVVGPPYTTWSTKTWLPARSFYDAQIGDDRAARPGDLIPGSVRLPSPRLPRADRCAESAPDHWRPPLNRGVSRVRGHDREEIRAPAPRRRPHRQKRCAAAGSAADQNSTTIPGSAATTSPPNTAASSKARGCRARPPGGSGSTGRRQLGARASAASRAVMYAGRAGCRRLRGRTLRRAPHPHRRQLCKGSSQGPVSPENTSDFVTPAAPPPLPPTPAARDTRSGGAPEHATPETARR